MKTLWLALANLGQDAPSERNPAVETVQKVEAALGELVRRAQEVRVDPTQWPEFLEFPAGQQRRLLGHAL